MLPNKKLVILLSLFSLRTCLLSTIAHHLICKQHENSHLFYRRKSSGMTHRRYRTPETIFFLVSRRCVFLQREELKVFINNTLHSLTCQNTIIVHGFDTLYLHVKLWRSWRKNWWTNTSAALFYSYTFCTVKKMPRMHAYYTDLFNRLTNNYKSARLMKANNHAAWCVKGITTNCLLCYYNQRAYYRLTRCFCVSW